MGADEWAGRVTRITPWTVHLAAFGDAGMKYLRTLERGLFAISLVLMGLFVAAYVHKQISSRADLKRFEETRTEERAASSDGPFRAPDRVNTTLWSKKRIEDYEHSLTAHFDAPLAVLRIPKVGLEVAVLEGTDDLTLNRGVGHIPGTARPGENGNSGIAGHRDGFFRVLKDVGPGDTIELLAPGNIEIYRVDRIVLVSPSDVSVLQPTTNRSLTLVTCYPFYFIGSAPQRYIVQASMASSLDASALGSVAESGSKTSAR